MRPVAGRGARPAAALARAVRGPQVHYVMGTYLRITADGAGAAAGDDRVLPRRAPARRRVLALERDQRAVAANATAPGRPDGERGHGGTARPFARAVRRHRTAPSTSGVGPLTALWRRPEPPGAPRVAAARAAVAPRDAVRVRGDRVALGAGARLDFDGIAKGWAVDAARSACATRASGRRW